MTGTLNKGFTVQRGKGQVHLKLHESLNVKKNDHKCNTAGGLRCAGLFPPRIEGWLVSLGRSMFAVCSLFLRI